MSGVKISALPAANAANDTDQVEVNQGGTSRRVTVGQIVAFANSNDFGNVFGGVSGDATAALQAAIDTAIAERSLLIIPAGVDLVVSARLVINGPIDLVLDGTITNVTTGVNGIFVISAGVTDVSITGRGSLIGPYVGTTPVTTGLYPGNLAIWFNATSLNPARRCRIEGITIEGWGDSGIFGEGIEDSDFLGLTIDTIGIDGIRLYGAIRCKVNGNTIRHMYPGHDGDPPFRNVYGVAFTRNHLATLATSFASADCVCCDNIVDDAPGWKGLDTHGGQNIVFAGNVVSNAHTAIGVSSGHGSSNPVKCPSRRITIANNIAHSPSQALTYVSASGSFVGGDTLAGATSGATGLIRHAETDAGINYILLINVTGTFALGEVVTGSAGGSATTSSTALCGGAITAVTVPLAADPNTYGDGLVIIGNNFTDYGGTSPSVISGQIWVSDWDNVTIGSTVLRNSRRTGIQLSNHVLNCVVSDVVFHDIIASDLGVHTALAAGSATTQCKASGLSFRQTTGLFTGFSMTTPDAGYGLTLDDEPFVSGTVTMFAPTSLQFIVDGMWLRAPRCSARIRATDGTVRGKATGIASTAKAATGKFTITPSYAFLTTDFMRVTATAISLAAPVIVTAAIVSTTQVDVYVWNLAGAATDVEFSVQIFGI